MVRQPRGAAQRGRQLHRSGRPRVKDQIRPASLLEGLLQARKRQVHGGRRQLRGLQSEPAIRVGPDHRRDPVPQALQRGLGPGDGRVARDHPRFGKANHQGVAHLQT